jgi:hypothetical protein
VGPVFVLQQTPLAVTGDPPSAVIVPPDIAVVDVIEETVVVESVASCDEVVVNDTWSP